MNKAGLIEKISEEASLTKKQVEDVIENLITTIIAELKAGHKVNLVGFGTFEARKRHTRGGKLLRRWRALRDAKRKVWRLEWRIRTR
jgi:DNA-binding protein HU-beta